MVLEVSRSCMYICMEVEKGSSNCASKQPKMCVQGCVLSLYTKNVDFKFKQSCCVYYIHTTLFSSLVTFE